MQFREVELQAPAQQFNNFIQEEGEKMQSDSDKEVSGGYYRKEDEQDSNSENYQERSTQKGSLSLPPQSLNIEEGNASDMSTKHAKSSSVHAYMNLFKGYIGSGILALPYAFTQAGWVLSTLIFLLVAFIVYETMHLLFELADSFNKEGVDYQFIAKHHFGRKGTFTVSSFIVIFQVGCCISYVIFFMKFLENVFDMAGKSEGNDNIIYLLIALTIIIPMSFINSITAFAKISILANFMIIVTLLAIFSYNIQKIGDLQVEKYNQNLDNTFDISKVPMMIGVSIYAFEAIGLIFSIRNSVENPQSQFLNIFRNTNIVMVCLYIVFSVIAVIAYGNDMNEIILFNLPNDKKSVQFFQIMYAFALIMSYPLQLLPTFKILESNRRLHKFIYRDEIANFQQKESCGVVSRRMVIRVIVTLCICFCAYAIPRFAVFLNIIGAVAGTSLQFILPIIMYLSSFKDSMKLFKKIKLYIYFAIGIIGGSSSLIFSLIELFQQRKATETDTNRF